ncbi:MAG: hypothetical protein AB1391_01565 [Candidatus Micrarchaeota archaeon]
MLLIYEKAGFMFCTIKQDKKNKSKKAQSSAEYLIILVVVLVVALIVIGLLGGFSGFGTTSVTEQSHTYWQGTTPFSIEDMAIEEQNISS